MIDDLDAIEDNFQESASKEKIEKSIEDWKKRLHDLFRSVASFADTKGWRVDESGTVNMHEEIMQNFGVPATDQPTLRLDAERGFALFKPKGLWVIGANGRIDLYTSKGVFVIVDLAKLGSIPRWTIYRAIDKQDGDIFVPEMVEELI